MLFGDVARCFITQVQLFGASPQEPTERWWGTRGFAFHLKLVVLSFNVADYKSGPQKSPHIYGRDADGIPTHRLKGVISHSWKMYKELRAAFIQVYTIYNL
jgi:hypothetical protein